MGNKPIQPMSCHVRYLVFSVFLMVPCGLIAADVNSQPSVFEMPKYIYDDYKTASERLFTEEAKPYWWAVGLSTAVMIATDDKWIEESQRLGKKWGISSDDNTTTVAKYKDINLLRLPKDTGSLMYFIGDGWTHAAIAAGFLATGTWSDDDKAYNVGFQLVEGMISTTIATQTLKHITGRESPSEATTRTGAWDFFPNQKTYFDNVAKYDAFPSGHLAVGVMTLTVVSKSYPEKAWIMPTGVTLLSLLSFQMMNNEVHWASDYPLAIALGYTFGSIAFERGQMSPHEIDEPSDATWLPLISADGIGLAFNYAF